ncbi:MBL fold metallo-hydrolase [Dasania sp. GY-MA-18]|uniref:MBL fold metallo-hydrolase n=1 Tax=Dasania phycosphaerae TaxID=2950436 RepID=A0A9J6RQL0_9GAMM|nr:MULTISPECIES: MBL fold metallo-hydrolase [Dasania]MCR8924012.1 MBL fold metallo-hydrolase [Dasania sp. GY-MA-18]MCZ0866585.1 MBL fold metallo-hydrolase [Dasania phycosphaerae]MCZ0870170.1 MBL fold metallo-hydrolase [Dasania phycosphaerae]
MKPIIAGECVQLSKLVRRITAPNPGLMTGPGTNSYLIGTQQVAVIDPGPAEPSHIEAIIKACAGKLKWIFVTHTHKDHSPAAQQLAQRTGAQLLGNLLPQDDGHQDLSFKPDHSLAHNQLFTSPEFSLRALHTPGHVGNHLCFLLEQEGMLLAGDHIMQGSTVVIIPPYGDMQAYLASLQLLLNYPITTIAPAHGLLIEQPIAEIERLLQHRLARESKIIQALKTLQPASLEQLTAAVYSDVNSALHEVAQLSLWAHLLKLEKESVAYCQQQLWRLVD